VSVRPAAGEADDATIAAMFDDTVLLGAGFDRLPAGFASYRRLCLGWYLGPGRAAVGLAVGATGTPLGYALVCTDEPSATRWARRATAPTVATIALLGATGRLDRPARRFYRSRLHDLGALAVARSAPPAAAHAHLNVGAGSRQGPATIALVAHIDDVCRRAGHRTWYGEMNERVGRRRRALERLGFAIVASTPNHTLTAALGEPVERLTLLRSTPEPPP